MKDILKAGPLARSIRVVTTKMNRRVLPAELGCGSNKRQCVVCANEQMYYVRRIRYLTHYFHWIGLPLVVAYAEVLRLVYPHHLRVPPLVELVTTTYNTGIKLTKAAMQALEAQITRLPGLERWFVDIHPIQPPMASG
jgi:hypothetical protein